MEDTDIAAALLVDGNVLDKDDIPNKNQSVKCFSCNVEMTGVFCAACGQKNDDYRRSIFRLIGELIGSFTAIESRIWRTWGALLFKPGKVAREFADGARIKWSTPIRVFFAVSILLFGFMTFTKTQLISIDLNVLPKNGITKPHNELTSKDLRIKGAVRFFQTQSEIDEQNKTRNFDLIEKWLNGGNGFYVNSMGKNLQIGTGNNPYEEDDNNKGVDSQSNEKNSDIEKQERGKAHEERIARLKTLDEIPTENLTDEQTQEMVNLTQQELRSTLNKETQVNATNTFLAIVKNPSKVNGIVYKWLPRIMFLMMPITMFIGIIFIRGRGNALLYDHLVHAAYMHAVAFFLVFLGIMLNYVFPGAIVAKTLFIIMLIYLPLSLKRMFGRGWFKTIWASYGVGVIYAFTVSIIMIAVISLQIINLVTEAG